MRYFVSCVGRNGNYWGFDFNDYQDARERADFEVSEGPAASADVMGNEGHVCYSVMRD